MIAGPKSSKKATKRTKPEVVTVEAAKPDKPYSLADRLREPSTWSGIAAAILGAVVPGVPVAAQVAAGVAGVVGALVPERGAK